MRSGTARLVGGQLMAMQNLPEVITRADLANIASTVQSVGDSPLIGGDPKQWFDMVETALKFAERFNTQLERAVTTINAVQGMKNTGEDAGMIDLDDVTQPYRPPPREAVIQEPPEPRPNHNRNRSPPRGSRHRNSTGKLWGLLQTLRRWTRTLRYPMR